MSQRKSILQNEQQAPGSPLRRSSRIANSPAPPPVAAPVATVTRRRSSATAVEASAPAKLLKSKRLSLSQDNPVEAPSTPKKGARVTRGASKSPTSQNEKAATPAKRGRKSSIAKVEEENQRVASPAIGPLTTRRRSVRGQSTSPSKDKPEPAKTRGRRASITEKVGNLESIEENDASNKKAAPKTRRSLATRRTSLDVPEEMEDIKSVSDTNEKMEVIEEPKKLDLNPIIEIAEESEENVLEESSSSLNSEDKMMFKLAVSEKRIIPISPLSISPEKDSSVPSTESNSPVKFTDSPPKLMDTDMLNKTTQDLSEKTEERSDVDENLVAIDDSPVKSKENTSDPKSTPAKEKVNFDVDVKSDKKTNEDDVEAMDISQDDKSIDEDVVEESPTKSNEEKRFEDMQISSTKSKDSSELQDEQDSLEKSNDVPTSTDVKIVDESPDKSKDKSKLEDNEFVNESPVKSKKSLEDSRIVEDSPATSETNLEDVDVVKDSPVKLNDKQKSVDLEDSPTKSIDQVVDDQKASTSKDESDDMNVCEVSKQNIEVIETVVETPKTVTTLKEDVKNSPIKIADLTYENLNASVETKTDSNTSITTKQNTPIKTPKKVLSMKQMQDNSIALEKPITPSKQSPNVSASKKHDESLNIKKTPKSDVKKIEEVEQIKSTEKNKLSKSISEEANSLNTSNKKTPKKKNEDCLIVNEFEMVSSSDGSFHLNFSLPMADVEDKKDVLNSTGGSNNSDKENIQSPEKITVKTPSKVFSELKDVKNQSTPKIKLSELTKPVDDDIEMSLGNKSTDLIVNNVMVAKETDPEQDLIKVLNECKPETLVLSEKILNKSVSIDTVKTPQKQNLSEDVKDVSADNKQMDKDEESSTASPKEKEIDQSSAELSVHNKTVEMEIDVPALSTSSEQEIDKNVSSPNVGDDINKSKEESASLEHNDQESDSVSSENLSNNIEENNKSKDENTTVESEELESSSASSKTTSESSSASSKTTSESSSASSKTTSEESKETSDDMEGECNKLNRSQSKETSDDTEDECNKLNRLQSKDTSDDMEGECNKLNTSQSKNVEKPPEQKITDDDINVSKSMEKSSLIINDSTNDDTSNFEISINVEEVIKCKRASLLKIVNEEKSAVIEPVQTLPEADTVKSSENSDVDVQMPENEIIAEVDNEPKITSSTAEFSDNEEESEIMQVKSKKRSLKNQKILEQSIVESTEHLSVSKLSKKSDSNDLSDENLEESIMNKSHSSSKRKSNKRKSKSKKEEAVFSAEEDAIFYEEEEIETAKQVKIRKDKNNKSSKRKNTKIISDSDNECSEYDQDTSDVESNEDDENICNLQVTNDSDDDNSNNDDNFLDDMAMEGEEDTPSEGSNDLPEYGESLHSSESDRNDSDEDYEVDSFIDDNESVELLSGNEYDISDVDKKDKKKSKKKRSRILSISESDNEDAEKTKSSEEVVDIQETKNVRKSKSPMKAVNQIEVLSNITICQADEEELSDENVGVEEEKQESKVIVSDENNEIEESEKISDSFIKDKSRRKSKKRTSISLQENLKLSELTDETINEKIAKAVDFFCSSIKDSSGNVSLNVSLDYANNSSDDESKPSPPKKKKISIGSTVASKPKVVENKAEISLNESKTEKKLKRKSLTVEPEIPDSDNNDKLQSKNSPNKNKRRSTEKTKIKNNIENIANEEEPNAADEAPPKKKKKAKKNAKDSPVLDNIPTQHIEYLPESLITELAKNTKVSLRENSPINKNKTLKKKKIRIAPTMIGSDDWDIESMTRIKPSKSSIKPPVKMQLQKQQDDLPVNDFRNRKIISSSRREDFKKILKTKKNKLR
ncbi:PREDICTED: titin homolog [Nicrophorus vespilloides]|uniref:Titin homolog n=1 Tax=Nicrophorus vespilloides TaxID=110193 RepID=A0ABM1MYG1_NICVS|nr:PREDICTED: titin homolog [Nicrophorus vespilloides]